MKAFNNKNNNYDFSFIVASRNDNHGGNMKEKNQLFINRWIYHIQKYNLNSELIIVDWNSKIPLRKILKFSLLKKSNVVKIIEVSRQIHKKFQNSKKINFFQMIAKNVGARRANGKFLIFSNVDIIFSEDFFHYLSTSKIQNEIIYRVDRHDFNLKNFKNYKITEDKIKKQRTFIHKKNYSYDIKKNKKYYLRKTFIHIFQYLRTSSVNLFFSFCKFILNFAVNFLNSIINFAGNIINSIINFAVNFLNSIINFAGNILKLNITINLQLDIKKILTNLKLFKDLKKILTILKLFKDQFNINNLKTFINNLKTFINNLKTLFDKKIHTNACGDFTMIDKKSFYKLKGYYEFDGFSWHLDSLLLFKAYYCLKLNFMDLNYPIYHINHEPGKKYSTKGKISINKIKKAKLDFINDEQLLKMISNYRLNKLDKNDNKKNWGLGNKKLPIHII